MNYCSYENVVVNNKDNRVLMSQNYWSASCPLEIVVVVVVKTSIFSLEALLLGQIFVLRISNFCGETISLQFFNKNTLLLK